jgi:acetolactate synthase-1/2/3 large subunit
MHNPDFVAIAKAYHIDGQTVKRREDLDAAIAEMLKDDKPYLLVVEVEQKGMVYPMVPAGTCVTNILLGE